jgi:hypothetical protein
LRASNLADQHGAEVQAIAGAHALVNIIRCSSREAEARLVFVEVACEEGALELALGWLDKYANIDVAVASSCWLAAYLIQSAKNLQCFTQEAVDTGDTQVEHMLKLFVAALKVSGDALCALCLPVARTGIAYRSSNSHNAHVGSRHSATPARSRWRRVRCTRSWPWRAIRTG